MTVFGFANLDQFRPQPAQDADLAVLRGTSDVAAAVEWTHLSDQRIWSDLPVLAERSQIATRKHYGQRIRQRHFRAVLIHPPGLPEMWVVVVHPPPLRMRLASPIYWATARNLRRFLRSLGPQPKVVFGDMNMLVRRDPCRLRRTFGGRWFGTRIDGAWLSAPLLKYVAGYHEVPQPERTDKHPFCYLTLEVRP